MRARNIQGWVLGLLLTAASTLSAYAAPVTIHFTYAVGNARAVGSVTFEDTLIANPGNNNIVLPDPAVLDITMTVTGASAGNGTYTTADFTGVFFDTNGGTLNLRAPLIGQPTGGNPWGTTQDGTSGDLNFFGLAAPTPNGVFFFTLGANGGAANAMILQAAGPLPGSSIPTLSEWMIVALALLLAGIGVTRVGRLRA